MSTQQFDVFFRGDIVAGQAAIDVKGRLASLFKIELTQVERLFSGRPTAIRRNLDEATAKKYEQAMLKIGAVVELRPVRKEEASVAQAAETSTSDSSSGSPIDPENTDPANTEEGLSLAPVGSAVLRPDERANIQPTEVDISALALEPGGGEILRDGEKRSVEKAQVDTSHLEVLPPR